MSTDPTQPIAPEAGEIAQARLHPGGWVFRVIGSFGPNDAVPPDAIQGVWKVDGDGVIVGEFLPNPQFDTERLKFLRS